MTTDMRLKHCNLRAALALTILLGITALGQTETSRAQTALANSGRPVLEQVQPAAVPEATAELVVIRKWGHNATPRASLVKSKAMPGEEC